MVELVERHRRLLERLAPRFWRRAAGAAAWTRRYFRFLLLSRRATFFVAEKEGMLAGMLVARRVSAPPVYDPGGPSLLIDDFCVAEPGLWPSVGSALLGAAVSEARSTFAGQIIVIAAVGDSAKAEWLASRGLAPASCWWVQSV